MKKLRILVIDDDPTYVNMLKLVLEGAGMTVLTAFSGKEGLYKAYQEHPDLILLDILMKGMDGFEVLKHLRAVSDVPVIMLTSQGHPVSHVRAMDSGATDFFQKGEPTEVLVAHIRSRAAVSAARVGERFPRQVDEDLEVDWERRRLVYRQKEVPLTPLQWRILKCLLDKNGRVASLRELLRAGWGNVEYRDATAVKVQISQLRAKLGDDPYHPRYIHTVREEGYRFEPRRTSVC